MLKISTDPAQRRVIDKLLLDEEAKLKKHEEGHKKNKSLPHVLDQRWLLSASSMWII